MTSELIQKKCVPCEGGISSLGAEEIKSYLTQVSEVWRIEDHHRLFAAFKFDDFAQALAFTNDVGRVAEEEGHHPDIFLSWGRVEIRIWTHAIDGLSENDFILAAKVDQLSFT